MISSDYERRCPNQRRGRPVDDNEIFVKNVGGVKKSRLYGIGSEIST